MFLRMTIPDSFTDQITQFPDHMKKVKKIMDSCN